MVYWRVITGSHLCFYLKQIMVPSWTLLPSWTNLQSPNPPFTRYLDTPSDKLAWTQEQWNVIIILTVNLFGLFSFNSKYTGWSWVLKLVNSAYLAKTSLHRKNHTNIFLALKTAFLKSKLLKYVLKNPWNLSYNLLL